MYLFILKTARSWGGWFGWTRLSTPSSASTVTPNQVSAVVAESTALGALLASALKYDGLFTLQTKSSGPVTMVVVDVSSDGTIRACATFDEKRIQKAQELRKTEGEIEAAPHLMGEGYLAFTVDQGKDTDLYQGVVDLQGKNLTECALRYFKQSEQIETALHSSCRLLLKKTAVGRLPASCCRNFRQQEAKSEREPTLMKPGTKP